MLQKMTGRFCGSLAAALLAAPGCCGTLPDVPDITPSAMPRIGTIDARVQSYNLEMVEVTGGRFDPVYIPLVNLRTLAKDWSGGTLEIFAWPSLFDTTKIKIHTGYTGQTVNWREGVKRTVAYMDENGLVAKPEDLAFEDALIADWRRRTA